MPTPFYSSSVTRVLPAHDNSIDSLAGGSRWVNTTISYSFPFSNDVSYWSSLSGGYGPQFGDGEPWRSAFTPLTSADRIAFSKALQQWANAANINFVQVAETPGNVGDIRAAYTSDPDASTLAWSYLPNISPLAGDVWINTSSLLNSQEWNPGNISFETLLHELGHALGLTHPFADPDMPSKPALPANLDSTIHTVMSYTYANLQGETGNEFSFHPTTPMVLDIAAVQYLYGANTHYHAGDDIYTFNDANTYHETLWDAGGSDTIRYDGVMSGLIDLNPGGGSFIGQPVYVQSNGVNVGDPVPNVWIANNVTIENATAGEGNDILIGNSSRNILDGGAGIDTVQTGSLRSQFTLNPIAGGYSLNDNANPGNQDTLTNIERVKFADAHIALDLDGHAGEVAKLLGAVFGAASVANQDYASVGLAKADKGLSYEQLATFAIDAAKLTSHDAIVSLLWQNLFGTTPSLSEKSPYVNMLDRGEISTGALAILAADTAINTDNIHLTGLAQTGLAYTG